MFDEVPSSAKGSADNGTHGATHKMHGPTTAPDQGKLGKVDDLVGARAAVVDAAGTISGLWTSFVFFYLYLVVTVGAVTHRQLLLEESIKLPVLSIDLPLVAF